MAAKRDLYEVLGISKTADEKTIKKAYRKLAKKYHPDMNPGDKTAEQKFKEATDAYNILSDQRRENYMINMVMLPLTEPEQNLSSIRITKTMVVLMEDIRNSTLKVEMVMISLVTFLEVCSVVEETTKDSIEAVSIKEVLALLMDLEVVDSEVDPSDRKVPTHTQISLLVLMKRLRAAIKSFICKIKMDAMQSLQVHIPAGIDTGKSVRLRGKGNPGIGGGEAGDLFLKVTVGEKQGFERKGNDVYTTINVPFSTAVCGGEAVIKTLYGNVICKIKEGTQSGSKIRLRGKGMPLMKNPSQKGDQYAVVQVQVPRNVSQQAKNKLKEFEALCGQRGNASY